MGRQNVLEHFLPGTCAFSKLEFSKSLGSIKERSTMEGEHWLWILQTLIKREKKKKQGKLCLSHNHVFIVITRALQHQI